jgi:hypothetical protein
LFMRDASTQSVPLRSTVHMLSYGTTRQDARPRVFLGIAVRCSARAWDLRGRFYEMTFTASLKSIRLIHRYLGLFFAPTILFFAITGGLQMFGLHETSRGSSYLPPDILVHLSQLHKKGTLYLPSRKVAPPNSTKPGGAKPDAPKLEPAKPTQTPPPPNSLPMKMFFAATALALAVSTCTGLVMSWNYARRKLIVLLTLAAGVVVPAILSFV